MFNSLFENQNHCNDKAHFKAQTDNETPQQCSLLAVMFYRVRVLTRYSSILLPHRLLQMATSTHHKGAKSLISQSLDGRLSQSDSAVSCR